MYIFVNCQRKVDNLPSNNLKNVFAKYPNMNDTFLQELRAKTYMYVFDMHIRAHVQCTHIKYIK